MKLQHLFPAAIVAALFAAPACAAPMLQFVDNLDSSVTLQVVTDAGGSLAAETAVEVVAGPGLDLTSVVIADSGVWDTSNPGSNPFTNSVTFGIYEDFANDRLFVSYGSGVVSPGTYDFLTIGYSGTGTLEASGLIAQQGVNNQVGARIDLVIPEPTTAVLAAIGLAGFAGRRRLA